MPYKDKEKQREFQRVWMQNKKQNFLSTKKCHVCSSTDNLRLLGVKKYKNLSFSCKDLTNIKDDQIFCSVHYDEINSQQLSERMREHGHSKSYATDRKGTPTYKTWCAMKQRCMNPNHEKFRYYGGRGISVCERWMDFKNFLQDMGERPDGTTIDRINNAGNYELANCRWASPSEQANNR